MRVYFDICALQRPLDDPAQLRVRLEAEAVVSLVALCEAGALDLVVSAAHEIENEQCPHADRRAHVASVLGLARHRASVSAETRRRASSYVDAGLTDLDALHLASAVATDCAFFCTTDDRLLRRGRTLDTGGTTVVSPIDLSLALP